MICASCGGWYLDGSRTPMNADGAANIGMDYDKQCPCTCSVCKRSARACVCKGGATYALVTHGLGGKPWRPVACGRCGFIHRPRKDCRIALEGRLDE